MTIHARRVRVATALWLIGVLAPPAVAQEWNAITAMPLEATPLGLELADFDGDGRLDVAVVHSQRMVVRLIRSDDASRWDEVLLNERGVTGIAAGDVNQDGNADLVVVRNGILSVYHGDGRGGFVRSPIWLSPEALGVALADMNRDGRLDVVAPCPTLGIHVFLHDGADVDGYSVPLITPGIVGRIPQVADFDGDGLLDVALTGGAPFVGGPATVSLGDGAGGFSRTVTLEGGNAGAYAILDFDGDGRKDFAVGRSQSVFLYRNDPELTFPLTRTVFAGGANRIAAGEFDQDGLPDLIVGSVSMPPGQGLYAMYGERVSGPRPLDPLVRDIVVYPSTVADFDRDGFLDVVATVAANSYSSFYLIVVRGSADGFVRPTPLDVPSTSALATGDVNGDGHADLAVVHDVMGQARLSSFLFDGRGEVSSRIERDLRFATGSMFASDVDSDGRSDLVLLESSSSAGRVALLLSTDGGYFDAGDLLTTDRPRRAIFADFDGDGRQDILIPARTVAEMSFGDGAGAFPRSVTLPLGSDFDPRFAADFDEDGLADVVSMEIYSRTLYLYHGDPSGLRGPTEIALPDGISRVEAAADVDEDGHVDLIASSSRSFWAIYVFYGDGAGGFPRIEFSATAAAGLAEDVNGDGHVDLVSYQRFATSIFAGDGRGGFSRSATLVVEGEPRFADLDEDGRAELVFLDSRGPLIVGSPRLDPRAALVGTVNRRFGSPESVLFVNDASGGVPRRVRLVPLEPIIAFMAKPPRAAGDAVPFALYAWEGEPAAGTARVVPRGVGTLAMPPPFAGGSPRVVWNSTGRAELGAPTQGRSPRAPDVVFRRPLGARRAITFTLQGVIFDPGSRAERPWSVTNGVVVDVR